MITIVFSWQAEVSCLDVGERAGVVRKMFWRCTATASDGITSCSTIGNVVLGEPDPEAFVELADVSSDVIRSWVPDHEAIEADLTDKVNITYYMPEPFVVSVPMTEEQ